MFTMLTCMGKLIPPFDCEDSEIIGVAGVNTKAEQHLWLYLNSCPDEIISEVADVVQLCALIVVSMQAAKATLPSSFRLPDSNGFQFALYLLAECGYSENFLVSCDCSLNHQEEDVQTRAQVLF